MKAICLAFFFIITLAPESESKEKPNLIYWYTGNALLELCESESSINQSLCEMYIIGVYDIGAFYENHVMKKQTICAPRRVTSRQLKDITVKKLLSNPEERAIMAGPLIVGAMAEAFPCSE